LIQQKFLLFWIRNWSGTDLT